VSAEVVDPLMPTPAFDAETLAIGTVGRPHGLRGDLTLRPHNTSAGTPTLGTGAGRIARVWLEKGGRRDEWRLETLRPAGAVWIFRLAGIASREAADKLTNAVVRVARSALPPLAEGEFFVEDLVGCRVVNHDGHVWGRVDRSFWNGAQDVMVVRREQEATGEATAETSRVVEGVEEAEELLIPVVPAFVRSVDARARQVMVEWSLESEEIPPEVRTRGRESADD
jgi:16S rRNA processing protein RimM